MFRKVKHPALAQDVLIQSVGVRAWRGILCAVVGDHLILRGCMILDEGSAPVKADGEVLVHHERIDYIQVLNKAV